MKCSGTAVPRTSRLWSSGANQERASSLQGKRNIFLVVMAAGIHPFPFRTRKLSLPAPMVLGGRPPGRVGRRQIFSKKGLFLPRQILTAGLKGALRA